MPGRSGAATTRIRQGSKSAVRAAKSNDPAGFDLVINASPLGLHSADAMPCDVARMEPHAALVDILMKNQPTPLVRATRARGLVAQPGFEMMIQQTHLCLDFFGLHHAARTVRADSNFIRELIYPEELLGEIPRSAAGTLALAA